MNKILVLLSLVMLASCGRKPAFKVDQCIIDNPFVLYQILEVGKKQYTIRRIFGLFKTEVRVYDIRRFDDEIRNKGLVAESCDVYRSKK